MSNKLERSRQSDNSHQNLPRRYFQQSTFEFDGFPLRAYDSPAFYDVKESWKLTRTNILLHYVKIPEVQQHLTELNCIFLSICLSTMCLISFPWGRKIGSNENYPTATKKNFFFRMTRIFFFIGGFWKEGRVCFLSHHAIPGVFTTSSPLYSLIVTNPFRFFAFGVEIWW